MEGVQNEADPEQLLLEGFTFSSEILTTGEIEDVTSNCVDLQGCVSEAVVELQQPQRPQPRKLPPHPTSRMKHNFSLPSVVIHSANNVVKTSNSTSSTPTKKKKKQCCEEAKTTTSKAERSQSFHVTSRPVPIIPRLQLPEDTYEQQEDQLQDENNVDDEIMLVKNSSVKSRKQRRRKSLVHLIFKSSSGSPPGVKNNNYGDLLPPDHGAGGQRLHFRRLSDIICRGSSSSKIESRDKKDAAADLGSSGLYNSHQHLSSSESSKATESTSLLRQLFPYRRRRSSVSHLDHTEAFHETKDEYIEATRRRMSSFPPCDGDESAIMLQKIHYLSTLEGDEQTRAATPVSASMSPLKLLRKSLLNVGGGGQASNAKWKSSTDIPSTRPPEAAAENAAEKPSFLAPSLPYSSRRGSSPLVAELNALRAADQRDKKAASSVDDRPGVVVFPRRKVEDVPGIFIPKKAVASKGDEDLGSRISHFLGVKELESRRRHSLSDPALLQQQLSKAASNQAAAASSSSRPTWLQNLRSPVVSR